MANELEQQMILDAQSVLSTLVKVDQAYAQFDTRVQSLAGTIANFNKVGETHVKVLRQISNAMQRSIRVATTGSAAKPAAGPSLTQGINNPSVPFTGSSGTQANQGINTVTESLNRLDKAANKALGDASKQTQNFTVSWETLTRVVTTQLIVRAMSQIRDAISSAGEEAIKFQRQISLIRTIAEGGTFEGISSKVRDISDAFNIPLLETAAGVYQSISNQVGTLGESLEFTGQAAKFARATNSSLSNSVDLLSGAIRSYGLSVEDTERVSGIFFTAIDKGRITADELGNAFGRVGPRGADIGISLEEISAGIATISDRGVKTSETLTQFGGIINALAKPTTAMSAALKELGFASPEAAIGTLRLSGVLSQLAKNTDGSAQSFAELFPNLRGVNGAITLSGAGLKTFADNIEAATANQGDYLNQKFGIAVENDGEKISKAATQIRNALVVDIGQSAVKTLGEMLDLVGGTENLIGAMRVFGGTLPAVIKSATGLAIAIGAIKASALLAAHPIAVVATGLAALNLAVDQTFKSIEKARLNPLIEGAENLGQSGIRQVEIQRKANKELVKNAQETTNLLVRETLNRLRPVQAAYDRQLEIARQVDAQLVADTERTLDRITDARQKYVKQLDSGIQDSADKIRESISRIQDIRLNQENREFDFRINGLDEAGRSAALLQRADDLARTAQRNLFSAFSSGNEELQKRAQSQFQAAQAAAEEAQAIARNNGNRSQEAGIVNRIKGIVEQQAAAEGRINQLQLQRQRSLKAERDNQARLTTELTRQAKIVLDNTGREDKEGNQFSAEEQVKRRKEQVNALKRIAELQFNQRDFKVADFLGLTNAVRDMQDDLSAAPIQLQFDVARGQQQVTDIINNGIKGANLNVNLIERLGNALGKDVSGSVDQISRGVIEAGNRLQTLIQQQGQEAVRQTQEASIERQIDSISGNAEKAINKVVAGGSANATQVRNLRDINEQLRLLMSDAQLATADVEALNAKFRAMKSDFTVGQLGPSTQAVEAGIGVLRDLATVRQASRDAGVVNPQEIANLQGLLREINQSPKNTLANSLQSAELPAAQLADYARQTANQYVRAANAANSIQGPTVAPAVAKQFGGMYFANGGMARGVDRVPAMLSEGEIVLNSRASAKFFSQFTALNAGMNPTYRQSGGSVTNVGDINVNLGNGNPKSARQLAVDLRREFRRGSSK